MSKYQALIDALKAGPTDGPWKKRNGFDDEIEIFRPDASLKRPYIAHQICTVERDHMDAKANIAFLLAANPATIRALLADLERAEKALREVVAVFDSNQSSIVDTVWVTGNRPETLYDHCQAALAQMAGG